MALVFMRLGILFGGLSVALGAFAAHALKQRLDAYSLGVFQTGVLYQMFHALALILFSFWLKDKPVGLIWPGWCYSAGVVLFSGSLYLLALTGVKKWGAITPLGGLLFLAGWIGFAWASYLK